MASTRNNNTPGNYCIRQTALKKSREYLLNPEKRVAYKPALPQEGIFVQYMPANVLSRNAIDIESALYGINSTNLVDPQKPVIAELNRLPNVQFYKPPTLIVNEPFQFMKNQRPFPIGQ